MRTIDGRTRLEVLSENECLLLLSPSTVGRLALIDRGVPRVFPVNFHLDGRTVVFRTDAGPKLDLLDDGPVAFEVDELDPGTYTGWSVVLTGWAHEVTDPDGLPERTRLRVRPWPIGPKSHFVRIVPDTISGRRIVHVDDVRYGQAP